MTSYAVEQDLYDIALPLTGLPETWTPTQRTSKVLAAIADASDVVDSYLRKVMAVPLAGSVLAPAGVTHAGTGPAVTITGTPDLARSFVLLIATGGARGAATFCWSKNGASTWDGTAVTTPAGGTYVLGTTGLTANFAAGTYVQWETYFWQSIGWPRAIKRAVCILAAYDLLSGRGFNPDNGTDTIVVARNEQTLNWLKMLARGEVEVITQTATTDTDGDGVIDSLPTSGCIVSQTRRGWT